MNLMSTPVQKFILSTANWVEAWIPDDSFNSGEIAADKSNASQPPLPGQLFKEFIFTRATKSSATRVNHRRTILMKDLLRKVVTLCDQGFLSSLEKKLVRK